ncbi:MAG TPA: S-layer homology domain-containing protein [Oscillospiraceae bacterium]|nr:S-layer homology domain-containing protein [Oscillospiraceae bacterium]
MIRQRKNFVFTITLTLAILLVTILSPLSVQAAEVKVNTEQQLRNAINNASDGDVINVTGNITLKDGQLWVKHNKALTIRSGNNSVITAGDHYFLLLQNDANVTLAGNIRVESSAKSATIYVDKSTFTLNENAVINCKNTLYGIYSPEKSRVIISGGSINVTGTGSDYEGHYGIYVMKNSTVGLNGGSVKLTGKGDNAGVFLLDSIATMSKGKIDAEGRAGQGVWAKSSTVFMSGGEIKSSSTYGSTGIQLIKGKLYMSGGSISATGPNDSWGLKAQDNCEIFISSVAPRDTKISGGRSGITLVDTCLADITISKYVKITGGVYDQYSSMIGKLPEPVSLTAGKTGNLQLTSGDLGVDYLIDKTSSSKLDAKVGSGKNTYTLYSNEVGIHDLVLAGKSDSGQNTLKLQIPVKVTAAAAVVIPFSDVKESDWACAYIMNLYEKGIIKGYPDGTFRPNHEISRQHAAKMITLGAGLKYQGKKADFPDVDPNGEMSPYIAALVEKGAIRGYPDGTFRPTQSITRGQIAQIVAKAFDLKMGKLPANFKDLPAGEAGNYIKILASNGIVKGYSDGTFRPQGVTTRAQFCKILTIAMAVSGVQEAEKASTIHASGRDILTPAIAAAQVLIDVLPSDQDLETKQNLQARLDALK